jgi:hypothetical protein
MARVNAGFPLNTKEAAVYLGEAPSTLEKRRCSGTGPRFFKGAGISAPVRYDPKDLIAYNEASRRESTSDPGTTARAQVAPKPIKKPAASRVERAIGKVQARKQYRTAGSR